MKKWNIANTDTTAANKGGTLADRIRKARGEIAESCSLANGEPVYTMPDPFTMKGMTAAVELIKAALKKGDKITIFGDYDCDGVTATVMLYSYLTEMGGEVAWYIPTRSEGYGMNLPAVHKIAANGTKLIITVDNGITAFDEAELARIKDLQLIITDHHEPGESLPNAAAIINPKQSDCQYPFKELAGCGVALCLIAALDCTDSKFSKLITACINEALDKYGDLAAIGTIADVVPLIGMNRAIVAHGLKTLAATQNLGLQCLLNASGLAERKFAKQADERSEAVPRIDATKIAFSIAPRINAAGRYSAAGKAVDLLLCENYGIATAKADELCQFNIRRTTEEREILNDIEERIAADPGILAGRLLILYGKNWNSGIIGIVCSKLVSKYRKPCVIISGNVREGEIDPYADNEGKRLCKGSFRGVPPFSVHAALTECGDWLEKYGGHTLAGGFSILRENVNNFAQYLFRYTSVNHGDDPIMATVTADLVPAPSDITVEQVRKLQELQPFGEGNRQPVFCLPQCRLKGKRSLKDGKYVSFTVDYQGLEIKVLDFSCTYAAFWYWANCYVDLMVTFEINEFNSVTSVNAMLVDMRLSAIEQDKVIAAKGVYDKFALKEYKRIDPALLPRITPTDEEMKQVYDILKHSRFLDEVLQKGLCVGVNYCKLRVAIDIFEEVKLIEVNYSSGLIRLNADAPKVSIADCDILRRLREEIGARAVEKVDEADEADEAAEIERADEVDEAEEADETNEADEADETVEVDEPVEAEKVDKADEVDKVE